MIYASIVRGIVARGFADLNAGRIDALTHKFADDVQHTFIGDHALSGKRTSRAATVRWYERLLRLFPDIRFELQQVSVNGPPWHTLVTVQWTETNTGTDGVRTGNSGLNLIEICWGRVRRVQIYTDTETLQVTLRRMAAAGTEEALAPPIIGA
jgi:ketosteroid isomerase-like protein